MNIKDIQELLLNHLSESQVIRDKLEEQGTDLKWLKKAFWTLAGIGATIGGAVIEEMIRHAMLR